MCFVPQPRVLFRHINFQTWSEHGVVCALWLPNVLRPTAACTFLTLQLHFPKVSEPDVFSHFLLQIVLRATAGCNFSSFIWPATSAPTALASLLFDPPEPQNTRKPQCFVTFLLFRAPASSLFWLCSSLIFSISYLLPSDFLHVPVSPWLCFSICPYCRKLSLQTSFDHLMCQ